MMRRMTMLASPRVESCHRMLEMLEKSSVRVFRIPVREANKYFTSKMLLVKTLNQSILHRVPNNELDCMGLQKKVLHAENGLAFDSGISTAT